jgi:branched-chain amino acid transport system permease protein
MELLAQIVATLLIYACLALSLNFVMGKTSVWSVGHMAYFGIGALIAASVGFAGPLSLVSGVLLAALCGGILGLFVGLSTMRLRQDYFVILSIALSELILSLSISWKGPAGFDRLTRPNLPALSLQNDWVFIGFILVPFTLMLAGFFARFSASPLEKVCALIRTNESLARVLKISPTRYKLHCFWLGAAVASVCGALSTFFFKSTDPNQISLQNNLLLFAAVIFGGLNSIPGSVLAALLLIAVPTILESLLIRGPFGSFYASELKQLLFGLLMLLVVRFLPRGLAGSVVLSEPGTVE